MGKRIAGLRLQRGWTQVELARRAEISVTFLSETENDHRGMGVDVLERIGNALQASLDYLVRGGNRTPHETQHDQRSVSEILADAALRVRDMEQSLSSTRGEREGVSADRPA